MTAGPEAMGSSASAGVSPRHIAPSPETVEHAITWRVRLQSGQAAASEWRAWQRWLDDAPEHAEAWARLEAIDGKVQRLPARLAHTALERATPGRRRALLALGGLTLALTLGSRSQTWQDLRADYRTAVGERRSILLDDGTVVEMNTDTSFSFSQTADSRLLTLLHGEIFIATGGHDAATTLPAFIVRSSHGSMEALGTRFQVHQQNQDTILSVYEHAVALRPGGKIPATVVPAGQAVRFDHAGILETGNALSENTSWRDGILVARRMRLDAFLHELERYRQGWISHDESLSGLLISGTFPLDNTDLALRAVADALPIHTEQHTRYWVRVLPGKK